MIKQINSIEEFNDVIKGKNVLVDFNAIWCGPCKMMEPNLEKISENYKDLLVCSLNIDNFQDLAIKYNISAIPTLIIFNGGEPMKVNVGYLSYQQIETFIK